MRVRVLAGTLLAVPALLVATATNGYAGEEKGVVAFAGHITVVPGGSGTADVCFDATAGCLDGTATGAVLAKPVIGMTGSIAYVEDCTAVVPYAPVGTATLSFDLHAVPGDTSHSVAGQWIRAGLVAVILGPADGSALAAGAAVVAPAPHVPDLPLCGSPIDYVLTGAMAFA